jgi:hypothetical protein
VKVVGCKRSWLRCDGADCCYLVADACRPGEMGWSPSSMNSVHCACSRAVRQLQMPLADNDNLMLVPQFYFINFRWVSMLSCNRPPSSPCCLPPTRSQTRLLCFCNRQLSTVSCRCSSRLLTATCGLHTARRGFSWSRVPCIPLLKSSIKCLRRLYPLMCWRAHSRGVVS